MFLEISHRRKRESEAGMEEEINHRGWPMDHILIVDGDPEFAGSWRVTLSSKVFV